MRGVIIFLLVILFIYSVTLSIFIPKALDKAIAKSHSSVKVNLASAKPEVLALKSSREESFVIPTNTPTPTSIPPTPTPTPTSKPTPTSVPKSSGSSTQTSTQTTQETTQAQVAGDDIQSYIINAINDYRATQGLSSVSMDSNTCNFASKRAGELTSDFSHSGFKDYPYPSYSKVTENIAMNSDYKKVVQSWIASSGHAENMRADTPYVCVAKNGNYYAYEGWKP